jgi:hypothetical protein
MKPGEVTPHGVFGPAQAGRRRADGGVGLLAIQEILMSHCAAMHRSSMTHCTSRGGQRARPGTRMQKAAATTTMSRRRFWHAAGCFLLSVSTMTV